MIAAALQPKVKVAMADNHWKTSFLRSGKSFALSRFL
jgi:hypothetical protein